MRRAAGVFAIVRSSMRLALPSALSVALAFALAPCAARADGPYEGDWRPGPMRIEVAIDSWGSDCPAQPHSSTTPGGGVVHVTQSGDDLSFPGGHTTHDCWSENPAVSRVSRTFSNGTWRIVCRTPPDDARSETGTYTLHATTADTIEFRDATTYDWTLNGSHCTARLTTTQTFERVSAAPPPPSSTVTPPPSTTVPTPACTPGAPARVAIRPGSTDVPPGGRVCFTARVVDANGCAVPGGAAPSFELTSGTGGEIHGSCFSAASSASGAFVVTARAGELSGTANVTVRVLDLSDLIARRTEAGGVTGSEETATSGSEARVAARADTPSGGMPGWAIGASIAGVLLVIVAVIGLLTRGRKKPKKKVDDDSSFATAPTAVAPVSSPMPAAPMPATAVPEPAPSTEAKICPICRRGYAADVGVCPKDHEPLVPYAEFVQRKEQSAPQHTCPKCGTSYPAHVKFCGKDGSVLGS
jgi:hypothetical protein